MDDYIPISQLNDYIFCPYSIYLHNVYMETDEGLYHASPQTNGRIAHKATDAKTYSTKSSDIMSLSVCSDSLGIVGKIDLYKADKKLLIERKYQLKNIYRGQLFQLWAEYFCMIELGYKIEHLAFYETSTNKNFPIALPIEANRQELISFIEGFRTFNPETPVSINHNKCLHCIYCNLCDKTNNENVYT